MSGGAGGHCTANGLRVHHLRTGGERPPVVLLHGLFGSGACWAALAAALAGGADGAGFDVVMPDARGHGLSDAPARGYRYDDLADDVVGLVGALGLPAPGLPRPVLVGHSMGGLTAAVVAARRTGLFRGVVLVDPTFLSPERQREVHGSDVADQHRAALRLPLADLVAQGRARHPHREPGLVAAQAQARLRTSTAALAVLAPPQPPFRDLVDAVDVPTLLVVGDRSLVTPDLAAELRGRNPLLRVGLVRDAGHGLPFDRPGPLAELVLAFLRGLPGA